MMDITTDMQWLEEEADTDRVIGEPTDDDIEGNDEEWDDDIDEEGEGENSDDTEDDE